LSFEFIKDSEFVKNCVDAYVTSAFIKIAILSMEEVGGAYLLHCSFGMELPKLGDRRFRGGLMLMRLGWLINIIFIVSSVILDPQSEPK
jgi:hypothetical protein